MKTRFDRILWTVIAAALTLIHGDAAPGTISGLWKNLGGTKLRRGRKPGDPKYRRSRSPKRTHAQRHAKRRGWQ